MQPHNFLYRRYASVYFFIPKNTDNDKDKEKEKDKYNDKDNVYVYDKDVLKNTYKKAATVNVTAFVQLHYITVKQNRIFSLLL